ncbi:phospho-sugar mutase [Cryobacterium sp. 10S3]|uniref:phospho-sugar mutase n=2 Tax=Cryobacterium sp. 10S3 TaxID=3048582 RepID=UPI002AC8F730|nr:phospho-sugar mutase [Cryobacterium sp. 10S3]MEB0284931.1 phospho-sugar mutase [Cryobacterium sp. 10S3]WPX14056.1 phospho-sugar mutase [Cryobacterium sp. 10S3]
MSATETGTGPTNTGPTSTGPVDAGLTGTGEVRARGRHRALPDAPASALPPTLALEIVEIPVAAAAESAEPVPPTPEAPASPVVPAAAQEPAAAPLTAHPASAADEQAPVTAEMDATVAAAFVPAALAHPVGASTTSAPAPAPDDATTFAAATAWLAQDPDPETQAELRALLRGAQSADEAAITELHARFDERLAFGTAGLRGAIGAGSNRMNRVLVSQAAAGLAAFLIGTALPGQTPSVVIGYDGRKNSQVFAADSAAIMAGAGVRAILLPRLLPTPVLAFAVRHLDASAGVMVTASHNPAADNGYKVYLGGANSGSQIVSPDDAFIAAEIHRVATHTTIPDLPRGAYETAEETVVQAYIAATAATVGPPRAQVNAVYTAMHGVGWDTTRRVLEAAGYDLPTLVDAQIAPDPTFPTVAFPNPEEPGALDLAFATAREIDAELVIANDPDADRLAIAIPDADAAGGYRRLTGNEVGAILGWRAAERAELAPLADDAATDDDAETSAPAPRNGTLACSIVSSPALKAVADAYGMRFEETLTGFKWVSRAPGLVFGYEEALGYLVNPTTVRDKDGISAALALLSLVSDLKNEGFTLADHLHHFSGRFGHFSSSQISVRVTDLSSISRVMDRLRSNPPVFIGRIRVDHIDDLAGGFLGLPPSDVLRIRLVGGARVMVRPSGTEPKLKVYLDTSSVVGTVVERQVAANAVLAELERGMRELIA